MTKRSAPIFAVLTAIVVGVACAARSEADPSVAAPDATTPDASVADDRAVPAESAPTDAAGSDAAQIDGGLAADCATRRGGAFVTLRSHANSVFPDWNVRLWITSAAFIAKAKTLVGVTDPGVHPNFGEVIATRDCDAQSAWHVDPSRAAFVEISKEECDAHGAYVNQHLAEWVARPTPNWCPWSAVIAAVEERPL